MDPAEGKQLQMTGRLRLIKLQRKNTSLMISFKIICLGKYHGHYICL